MSYKEWWPVYHTLGGFIIALFEYNFFYLGSTIGPAIMLTGFYGFAIINPKPKERPSEDDPNKPERK